VRTSPCSSGKADGLMVRRHERIGPWVATAAGLLVVIACAGCGSGASQDPATHAQIADRAATGAYLRARGPAGGKTIYVNPRIVNPRIAACVRGEGLTVLSSGELQVSKTLPAVKLRVAENICGFQVEKIAKPNGNATIIPQPKRQSFRSLAVAKVVACLHKAGVQIPPSDSNLLSSTSGIKTRSPQVKTAIGKCRSESLTAASR
jgi:hypothetical protein